MGLETDSLNRYARRWVSSGQKATVIDRDAASRLSVGMSKSDIVGSRFWSNGIRLSTESTPSSSWISLWTGGCSSARKSWMKDSRLEQMMIVVGD